MSVSKNEMTDREVIEFVINNTAQIAKDAGEGCEEANKVIEFYRLYWSFQEPIAKAFLRIAVKEYNEKRAQ